VAFVRNVGRLISVTESYMKARQAKLQKELEKVPEYRSWYQRTADIQRESKLLEKIIEFMKTQSVDSSAISRSELHQRVRDVRGALFGRSQKYFVAFGSSPVMLWLDHSEALYNASISALNGGLKNLRTKYFYLVAQSDRRKSSLDESFATYEQLSFIKPSMFAEQSEGWKLVCKELEDIWMNWLRASDHLEALGLFCKQIEPLLAEDVESGIIETCIGRKDLMGRTTFPARVGGLKLASSRTVKPMADLVHAKRQELHCPNPEMFKE
jgi:hypothetical protein